MRLRSPEPSQPALQEPQARIECLALELGALVLERHGLRLQREFVLAEERGEVPVGAVIVQGDQVIGEGFNAPISQHDPTAHAEMVVIRRLCKQLKTTKLEGYTLYCTLQPCGMCTMACLWAGVSRIVYGAGRSDVNAVYFETRHANTADFIREAFRHDLKVEGEVLAAECVALYAKRDDSVPAGNDPAHTSTKKP